MATLVTIKNIGRQLENIPGGPLPIGDTLEVDLDDEAVRAELRTDADYVVLPDSVAGTLPPSGGVVAHESFPFFNYGFGTPGNDGSAYVADDANVLEYEGDGVTPLILRFTARQARYTPDQAGGNLPRSFKVFIEVDGVGTYSAEVSVPPPTATAIYTEQPIHFQVALDPFVGTKQFNIAAQGQDVGDNIFLGSGDGKYELTLETRPVAA